MEKFLYERLQKKDPKINLWFAYPGSEAFALASSGYLAIFKDFDLNPDLFVERIYSDTKSTRISPEMVDAMGFSVSFELDILSIIKMLEKYNFPLKSKERKEKDPIIFAGGPVLMSNPKPLEEFFDFILIGEKISLKNAFQVLKDKNKFSKDEILKKLSDLEGIYVPRFKKPKIKIERDNLESDIIFTPVLSDKSFFKDTFIVELERGCPKKCSFCLASWLNLPVRFIEYEKIIEAIDLGLNYTNKIALLGAYVAGHPRFCDIIDYISQKAQTRPLELSISSLRADLADIKLIKTLVKCGQRTATIALEAGSQRLRDFIKKDLSQDQILNTISTFKAQGLKGAKIYVMIGLPEENDEDIEALVDLAKKMKELTKGTKENFEITFAASTFIPKPHTPFEEVKRCDKTTLEKRINFLKKSFHKLGMTFRAPSIEWDIFQSVISRYDKSLADLLIETAHQGGTLGAFKQTWRRFNKEGLLKPLEEISILPFDPEKGLPWGFIDTGCEEIKERRKREITL